MELDENNLDFQMQPQLAALWCWAAVARGVFHFYDTVNNPDINSQCSIASALLNKACCPNPFGGPCEKIFSLKKALMHVNNYVRKWPDAIRWETLVREIDAGRVVCAFIKWSGSDSGGHFIAITGYTGNLTGTNGVFVDDSQGGGRHMSFEDLKNHYENREMRGGSWQHTFFTEP